MFGFEFYNEREYLEKIRERFDYLNTQYEILLEEHGKAQNDSARCILSYRIKATKEEFDLIDKILKIISYKYEKL